jgi:hypothetical protein
MVSGGIARLVRFIVKREHPRTVPAAGQVSK